MKVLLIKPCWPYPYSKGEDTYNRIWPPLSLANCAAILEKNGHRAEIIDAHARRIRPDKLDGFVKGCDKVFITSSSLDRWQCPNIDINPFLETARQARRANEEVYLMGYHGTVEPEKVLESTGARAVIRGEPEYAALEICQKRALSEISGISFKDNGRFISNPDREPLDLKSLPVPAYHLLDFKRYFYEILGKNFALFETSRGCRFRCSFCNKLMYGRGIKAKSGQQVFEEVSLAVERHNVRNGYFIDLDFLSDRESAEELCEYLIKKRYKFKWACQTRPDLLDAEILKIMREAGCRLIHLGMESSLQKLLDSVNKNLKVKQIEEAVRLCREAGIKSLVFVLFGLPGETAEDRNAVLDFVNRLNADFVSFHQAVAYKGTGISQGEAGPDQDVGKFMGRALIRYYLRPSYLCRSDLSNLLGGLKLFLGRIRSLG